MIPNVNSVPITTITAPTMTGIRPQPIATFTHADSAVVAKFVPHTNENFVQGLLLYHYPAGLPPGTESWGELLFKSLLA